MRIYSKVLCSMKSVIAGLHYVAKMYPGSELYKICSAMTDSQVQWQRIEDPFDLVCTFFYSLCFKCKRSNLRFRFISYRVESKRMSQSVDWAPYPPAGELLRSIRVIKYFWKLAKAHQHYLRSSLAINDTAAWMEVKKCFVSSWKSGFRRKRIKLMRISTLSTWAFFAFLFTYSTGYLVWSFTLNWLESKSPNNWTSWSSTSSIEFILLPQRCFGERDVKSDLAWHLYLIVYNCGKCLQKERNWGDIA